MEKSGVKISILGGCALSQKDIPSDLRFPAILKSRLLEEKIESDLSLFAYSDILTLNERVKFKIKIDTTDVLILHIRPQPFNIRTKFILKQSINNKITYKLNLSKTHSIYDGIEQPIIFNESPKKGKFEELNGTLGRLFGLHKKTAKCLLEKIYAIQQYCLENKIILIVLGSPSQINSFYADANNFYLDSFLQKKLTVAAIPYVSCYNKFKLNYVAFLNEDGLHLSSQGHDYIGRLLSKGILNLL